MNIYGESFCSLLTTSFKNHVPTRARPMSGLIFFANVSISRNRYFCHDIFESMAVVPGGM